MHAYTHKDIHMYSVCTFGVEARCAREKNWQKEKFSVCTFEVEALEASILVQFALPHTQVTVVPFLGALIHTHTHTHTHMHEHTVLTLARNALPTK